MIAIDTNLLVYAHRTAAEAHRAARNAIEKAAASPAGFGIPLPCATEFFSVVTHSKSPKPSTPDKAIAFMDALVSSGEGAVWYPSRGFWHRLALMARSLNVTGARVFDLQIAVVAMENGASELWSHDRHFVQIPGLKVVDPLADRL